MEKVFLDEGYRKLLAQTVESNRLPEELCQALGVDNCRRFIKNDRLRQFIYALNSAWLTFLYDFNLLNPFNSDRLSHRPRKFTWRQKLNRLIHFGGPAARGTPKLWPKLLLLVFIMAAINQATKVYYQYVYDANVVKLRKLNKLLDDTNERALLSQWQINTDQLQALWQRTALETRAKLKSMGRAYVDWTFLFQPVLLIFLPWGLVAYVMFPALYFVTDMTIMLPLALSEGGHFNRLRAELICHELDRFSLDCLTFAETKLEHMRRELSMTFELFDTTISFSQTRNLHYRLFMVTAAKLRKWHHQNVVRLKEIALVGGLNALNGTPFCRDRLALFTTVCIAWLTFYTQTTIWVGYLFSSGHFSRKGNVVEILSFSDVLDMVSLAIVIQSLCVSACLMVLIFIVLIYDQVEVVTKLRTLIEHVVRMNQVRFLQLTNWSPTWGSDRAETFTESEAEIDYDLGVKLARQFEQDIMTIVMHYRLALRTMAMAQRPLNSLSMMMITFAIGTPAILRIHSAYFDPELRLISLLVGIACSSLSYLSVCPLGLMHKRSIKTFNEIWNLVAQVSFYATVPAANKFLDIDSNVAVFTLRRALADSLRTADKLACHVLSVPITYNSLIKISFWIVLIMVSLSNNVYLYGDRFVRVISDPFNLYSFADPLRVR